MGKALLGTQYEVFCEGDTTSYRCCSPRRERGLKFGVGGHHIAVHPAGCSPRRERGLKSGAIANKLMAIRAERRKQKEQTSAGEPREGEEK